MTKKETASLVFSVFGAYAIVVVIPIAGRLISSLTSGGLGRGTWHYTVFGLMLPLAVLLLLGVCLILYSDKVAALATMDWEDKEGPPVTALDLHAIALSVLGVFAVLRGCVHVGGLVSFVIQVIKTRPDRYMIGWSAVATQLVTIVLELVIGTLLFFRGRALAKWWAKLASAKHNAAAGDK